MKFFHTALSVNNIAESKAFYETVFDMHQIRQGARPELGVKFIMLEGKDNFCLELFEHTSPKPFTQDPMDFQDIGFKHIAFIVDNIEEVVDKAVQNGAKVVWSIRKGVTIKRLAFISDPNGLPIELAEL